ncbi:MAG: signal peptidase II [Lachnospiraceae bacterium]|nr:signal peptidase II [Lachnospiraceae bacterium]
MKIIKSRKNILISWLIIAFLVGVDQIAKFFAATFLKNSEPLSLIDNVFELHYLENQSAAFGVDLILIIQKIFRFSYFVEHPDVFLQVKMFLFIIMTIAVVFLLYALYLRIPKERRFRYIDWILIAFIAGAIGNLIDRAVHHYVIDFFYFKLIDFPIFNVADIYVTVSAFFIIVLGLFYYKEADFERIFPSKEKKKD